MFTSLHWLILRKNEKGDNSVMDLQNFTKVNQVIYTIDTICDSNIMTLAQAVLDIFCSQASIWVIMRKKQKGDNSNYGPLTNKGIKKFKCHILKRIKARNLKLMSSDRG